MLEVDNLVLFLFLGECFLSFTTEYDAGYHETSESPLDCKEIKPLSMQFSRQEFTGVGSHSLLQGTFPTQGLKLGLLHCRQIFNHLSHQSESESEVTQSCPTLSDPRDCNQAPLSTGFSRQDYWSGLPFLSSGGLPNPGIKPRSPALQTCALPSDPPRKPI